MKNYFKIFFLFISMLTFSQTKEQKIEYILNLNGTIEQYKKYIKDYKINTLNDSVKSQKLSQKYNDKEIEKRIIKSFSDTYSSENIDKTYKFYTSEAGKNLVKKYSIFTNKIDDSFKEIDDEITRIMNEENAKSKEKDITQRNNTPVPIDREDGFYTVIYYDDELNLKTMKLAEKPVINCHQINEISKGFDALGRVVINIKLNKEGAEIFKEFTANSIGKPIAIVLNKNLISAPRVVTEIPEGKIQISGNFSVEEAEEFIKLKK